MSKRKRYCYVAWDEQIVCAEKGNRVVHYHLKDMFGNSMLAVVGTERSIRHMWYVATDELLRVYGTGGLINGNKQWRARREVVALLSSLVSNTETDDSKDDLASLKVNVPRTVKPQRSESEIVWLGDAWLCAKQLKHYPSFSIHGFKITVHSFVSILTEEGGYYICYLEDLYEDKKGMEKVRVRWFLNDMDDQQKVSQLKPHRKEVIITPYVQVISAKCVVGHATLLTPSDYEKLSAFVTQTSSAGILVCYRQVKDGKIMPFALPKLRGYLNQAIFSLLYRNYLICKANPVCSELSIEDEDWTCDDTLRDSADIEKYRNWELIQWYGFPDFRPSIPHGPSVNCRPVYLGLKSKLSKVMNKQFLPSEPRVSFSSEVNQKIELLCEDSGIRGCWFRCQILQRAEKRFQVMYNNLLDADESGNLEEWVPAVKLASLDKLGFRCPGRNTIRPPPPMNVVNSKFEVGMPVDAWWCDGWWEGVVTQVDSCPLNNLVIYFPGEDRLMRFQKKYVRRSMDWVGDRWVDLKPKPEIVTFLAANASNRIKSSFCSTVGSPREETPSTLNKDVFAPSNEGLAI